MADAAIVQFVMYGARAAIAAGMLHIREQVEGIERAVSENTGLAFDLARTLIESTCRSILTERKIPYDSADELPKLFKKVTNSLPFLPTSVSSAAEVRKSLVTMLNGLNTAMQGVCELRNQCGFASHRAEGPRPIMESIQAVLAAATADTIVGFLHRVHKQDITSTKSSPSYEANPDFNEYVNELYERVRIFNEEFEPSRILFELAPEPYRVYLTEFESESDK